MMNKTRVLRRRLRTALFSRWNAAPAGVRRASPLVMVLLIGLFIGSTLFGRNPQVPADGDDGIRAADSDDGRGDGVEWTCAMHPQVRQPGPGTCPICGMNLIPVAMPDEDGEHGQMPRLAVSERAAALMQVQVWPVERGGASGDVRLSGTIG